MVCSVAGEIIGGSNPFCGRKATVIQSFSFLGQAGVATN
jgi:hypothetical protein